MGLRPKEEKSLWKPIRRTKNNLLISQLDWLCSRLGKGKEKKKKTWEQKFHGNKHLLFMASIPGKLSVWLLESRSEVKVIVSVYFSQIEGTESPYLFYISTRSKYLYFVWQDIAKLFWEFWIKMITYHYDCWMTDWLPQHRLPRREGKMNSVGVGRYRF